MHIAVIGSGPSGVAAADTLLINGHAVDTIDVGSVLSQSAREVAGRQRKLVDSNSAVQPPGPTAFEAIHSAVSGVRSLMPFTSIPSRSVQKKIFGSDHVWERIEEIIPLNGRWLPRSVAKGGLSNVWGSACYPLRPEDYADWPVTEDELAPHYETAASLLGLWDREGGLERVYPAYAPIAGQPFETLRNPGSPLEELSKRWIGANAEWQRRGLTGGRASLATAWPGDEASTIGNRCRRCGLCHTGCPFGAIFSAGDLIDRWQGRRDYQYLGGLTVIGFTESPDRVTVHTRDNSGAHAERYYDRVVLAAGALSSLRICADSLGRYGTPVQLLDNDMFVVPMLLDVKPPDNWATKFTLSEAVIAVDSGVVSESPVHVQFYMMNEAFLPGPRVLFRHSWAFKLLNRMAMAFIYFHGSESRPTSVTPRRRSGNIASLDVNSQEPGDRATTRRLLRYLEESREIIGLRPMHFLLKQAAFGFSGHFAGTLPMAANLRQEMPLSTGVDGNLIGTRYVYVVDASTFPTLPAQNLTYTAMANSIRIASGIT